MLSMQRECREGQSPGDRILIPSTGRPKIVSIIEVISDSYISDY